jgi:hypothetical protein
MNSGKPNRWEAVSESILLFGAFTSIFVLLLLLLGVGIVDAIKMLVVSGTVLLVGLILKICIHINSSKSRYKW